jgi:DNA-binding HxlR family transcriptional regulator
MRSYAQYCPVAKATEILGDRWTLLILREMLGGASGFNELQRGLPGISRSVLTDRMRALERAEVIERRTGPKGRTLEYRLTPAGRDLQLVVQALGEWGATWSFTEPRLEELDPDLLIVWMARHVDRQRLPTNRTVVKFDFRDPQRRYWMVLEPSEVSVCLQHPGFDTDLEVIVDTATLYRVYLGRVELEGAIRAGQLTMSGPRTLQRGFGHWFTWSAFAPASRSAQERRTAATPSQSSSRTDRRISTRKRAVSRLSGRKRTALPVSCAWSRGVPSARTLRLDQSSKVPLQAFRQWAVKDSNLRPWD